MQMHIEYIFMMIYQQYVYMHMYDHISTENIFPLCQICCWRPMVILIWFEVIDEELNLAYETDINETV